MCSLELNGCYFAMPRQISHWYDVVHDDTHEGAWRLNTNVPNGPFVPSDMFQSESEVDGEVHHFDVGVFAAAAV